VSEPIPSAIRKTRKREKPRLSSDRREKIAHRVVTFFENDLASRSEESDRRLQLHAKYRQWTSGGSNIWEGSSDVAVPDMAESSLRTQDTLVNAVLSTRPAITSKAVAKHDKAFEEVVDLVTDTQMFVEQDGEKILQEMAESFTNDPAVRVFVPWVKERRKHTDVRTFEPVPEGQAPRAHFEAILRDEYPNDDLGPQDDEGWDWAAPEPDGKRVSFYTEDDGIKMVVDENVVVYDGPRVLVKDYEDVVHPPDVANLQAPGPSNPRGAPHVVLVDRNVTLDEIERLIDSGSYDLVTKKRIRELAKYPSASDETQNAVAAQRRVMAGKGENTEESETGLEKGQVSHQNTFTRLICFDVYDIDGDGVAEDVMWWVLLEGEVLLKAAHLTEMYPSRTPRRPIVETQYLPVHGRSEGISLLELTEGVHDWTKEVIDQMMDGGTLSNWGVGFYRPSSMMNPETIRLAPGDLFPLPDPSRDVHFPKMGNDNQSFGLNVIAMARQMLERLTLQGDIQSGRVPVGRSAALRTQGSIAMLLQQGDARPERVLRRFFIALREIYRWFHTHNQYRLPDKKEFLVVGPLEPGQSPYQVIQRDDIRGEFQFTFNANILNSNKQALQASLGSALSVLATPLAIQSGISNPDSLYRLKRDYVASLGVDQDRYVNKPTSESHLPRIDAGEAFVSIMSGRVPHGVPLEPAAEHLAKLQEIPEQVVEVDGPDGQKVKAQAIVFLDSPEKVDMYAQYLQDVAERAQREAQAAALAQAAAQNQGGGNQPGPGRPPESVDAGGEQPQVQGSELLDETLPSARGEVG